MRLFLPLLFVFLLSCGSTPVAVRSSSISQTDQNIAAPQFSAAKVVRRLPHAADSYTQGLLVHDGKFYESIGQYGQSALRVSEIETGRIIREVKLADRFFGEGLTIYKGKFYQLTWLEGTCLVYDARSLRQSSTISYSGEGWGIVAHNDSLILSDGSSMIRVVDPATLRTLRSITVHDDRGEVRMINEMELIDGMLYANIYMSPIIAVIDLATGVVERYIDCSALETQIGNSDRADVLNGIAYDAKSDKLYVTGKLWDTIFEIEHRANR